MVQSAKDGEPAVIETTLQGLASPANRAILLQLVFGETEDPPPAASPSPTIIADFAREVFTSWRFRVQIAEPALDRLLDVTPEPVSPELLAWSESAFDLPIPAPTNRWALLASVIGSSAMAGVFDGERTPWTVEALVDALQGDRARTPGEALEQLRRLSSGLDVFALQAIEGLVREPAIRFTSDDPGVTFRLLAGAMTASRVCRIDFGLISDNPDPMPTLFLDYADDAAVDAWVALSPRGRTRYAAFVDTEGLRTLRWKPDDGAGEAIPTLLSARPVSLERIRDRLAGQEGLIQLEDLWASAPRTGAARQLQISRILTRVLGAHEPSPRTYAHWIRRHELRGGAAARIWGQALHRLESRPGVTLLLLGDGQDLESIRRTVESVRSQAYPDWALCIPADPTRGEAAQDLLQRYAGEDARIRLGVSAPGETAGERTNAALGLAAHAWVARLGVGDVLAPQALLRVAEAIGKPPQVRIIYADEDRLDENGVRTDPWFKPTFSPELMLATDYFGGLVVFRTADVRGAGGWPEDPDAASLPFLILEQAATGREVGRIPEVLLHGRSTPGGANGSAGLAAVVGHLARTGRPARVEALPEGGRRVRHSLPTPLPKVSLIIPTRDKVDLLAHCVESILGRSTYPDFEIVIVDNASVEAKTANRLAEFSEDNRVRVIRLDCAFNYSLINNHAVATCRGEVLGLLNNDVEVITPDWIEELTSWAIQPEIGCVGAKLYYPDDRIQHAGVVLGLGGTADHVHKHAGRDDPGYRGRLKLHANVSAVTAACMFMRKGLYESVGGLDEGLKVCFNDVDLCIRLRDAGYRNVFTPFAELYHHESVSRGSDESPEKGERFRREIAWMQARWGAALKDDPFYSVNLTLAGLDSGLRWHGE